MRSRPGSNSEIDTPATLSDQIAERTRSIKAGDSPNGCGSIDELTIWLCNPLICDWKPETVEVLSECGSFHESKLALVRVGDRVRVKQLQRDLSQLKYEGKALQDYGKGDTDIAEFFGGPKKP